MTQRLRQAVAVPFFSAVAHNAADEDAEEIEQDQHDQCQSDIWQKPEEPVQPSINLLEHIADVGVDLIHCASPPDYMICKRNDLVCRLVPFAVSAADTLGRLNAAQVLEAYAQEDAVVASATIGLACEIAGECEIHGETFVLISNAGRPEQRFIAVQVAVMAA